jgi:hypothetical protein
MEEPKQTVLEFTLEEMVGVFTTVIVSFLIPMQPKGLLPVIVYIVVAKGFTVNVDELIFPGMVVNEAAPDKLMVAVLPAQIVGLFGETVIEGIELTVTPIEAVFTHPCKSLTVTVYPVTGIIVGFTMMLFAVEPVFQLKE